MDRPYEVASERYTKAEAFLLPIILNIHLKVKPLNVQIDNHIQYSVKDLNKQLSSLKSQIFSIFLFLIFDMPWRPLNLQTTTPNVQCHVFLL